MTIPEYNQDIPALFPTPDECEHEWEESYEVHWDGFEGDVEVYDACIWCGISREEAEKDAE